MMLARSNAAWNLKPATEVMQALERSTARLPAALRASPELLGEELRRAVHPLLVEELEDQLIDDVAVRAAPISHRLVRLLAEERSPKVWLSMETWAARAKRLAPLEDDLFVPDGVEMVEVVVRGIAGLASEHAVAERIDEAEEDFGRFRGKFGFSLIRLELLWLAFREAFATSRYKRASELLDWGVVQASYSADAMRSLGFVIEYADESPQARSARFRRDLECIRRDFTQEDFDLILPDRLRNLDE